MTFYSLAEERSSSADRRFNKLAESLRAKSQPQLSLWWFKLAALNRSNSTDSATTRKVRPTGSRLSRRDAGFTLAVMKRSSSRDRRHIPTWSSHGATCTSGIYLNSNLKK